jgi:hypothetical protein
MTKPRKGQPEESEPTIVTSRVLAERAAALYAQTARTGPSSEPHVVEYGFDLSKLLRPGERLQSNRRALFEPDEKVDAIVKQEMKAIRRVDQALPADMDPHTRLQLLDDKLRDKLRYWFSQWRAALQPADTTASAQGPAPTLASAEQPTAPVSNGHQKEKRHRRQGNGKIVTVQEAAEIRRVIPGTIYNWIYWGWLPTLPRRRKTAIRIRLDDLLQVNEGAITTHETRQKSQRRGDHLSAS